MRVRAHFAGVLALGLVSACTIATIQGVGSDGGDDGGPPDANGMTEAGGTDAGGEASPDSAAADASPDSPDTGRADYATTQYNSSLNPGYFTYPGYYYDGSKFSCPASGNNGYNQLQFNLYMPNLPNGGKVPLLLFFPGSYDDLNLAQLTSGLSDTLAKRAAQLGFAAAAVSYYSWDGLILNMYPDRMDAKQRCVFDSDISSHTSPKVTDNDAITQLCGNLGPLANSTTQVDCSKGFVAAGHSQGGFMAALAKNYDARVAAAYTIGTGTLYNPQWTDLASQMGNALFCYVADPAVVMQAKGALGCPYSGFSGTMGSANHRVLPSAKLRAEVGDVDPYFADPNTTTTVAMVAVRLNDFTDLSCAGASPGTCGGGAGQSTWFIVGGSQLAPCMAGTACTATGTQSHAGHCFFSDGDSPGCTNNSGLSEVFLPDPNYVAKGSTDGWTLDGTIGWLQSQLP